MGFPKRRYRFESLEPRNLLAGIPYGAVSEDTAEFLLGDVHVNVVFLESTGDIDPSTENWTPQHIAEVKQNVVEGISWWRDALAAQNSVHELNFHFDFTFADVPFQTSYEPIARVSEDYRLWLNEFLDQVGFGNLGAGDIGLSRGIRAFNHSQRIESNSHWGFTLFVVNSENDADGQFKPGGFSRAFAFPGGRFIVSPSTRPASTFAHEMGHIFYALDEHGSTSYSARRGYYNIQNLNAISGNPNPNNRVLSIMADHEPRRSVTNWVKVDGDTATGVLPSGHLYTNGLYQITWTENGVLKQRSDVQGTVVGNALSLDGGAGDEFPPTGTDNQFSIMAHRDVFGDHLISTSAKEMVGWRDSDGDGIFDVLDVPLSLTGSGAVDPATGQYRFVGQASVGTLRNLNPSSFQSDITINEVSRIQYRIDGGPWIDIVEPHAYTVDLDFTFPVPAGVHHVEIRALDDATNEPGETGVMSAIFHGVTDAPTATTAPGINGYLWNDEDGDGVRDITETPLAGWTVEVRSASGQPLDLRRHVEPDDYNDEENISDAHPGVMLTSLAGGVTSSLASVRTQGPTSTGVKVFAYQLQGGSQPTWSTEWTGTLRQLHMEFTEPVSTVSIDAVGNSDADFGRLEIYDGNRNLIGRMTTAALANGQSATMTLSRPTAEIKYAIAMGHADSSVQLDNLRFGPTTTAVTDVHGAWSVPNLGGGDFTVRPVAPPGWQFTIGGVSQAVSLDSGGVVENIVFGFQNVGSPWRNGDNPADINRDGLISNLDLLAVVQFLRDHGIGSALLGEPEQGGPLVDADGDSQASLNDLLIVIAQLRAQLQQQGNGEGEASLAGAAPPEASFGPASEPGAESERFDGAASASAIYVRTSEPAPHYVRTTRGERTERRPEARRDVASRDALRPREIIHPANALTNRPSSNIQESPRRTSLHDDEAFDCLLDAIALDVARGRHRNDA